VYFLQGHYFASSLWTDFVGTSDSERKYIFNTSL